MSVIWITNSDYIFGILKLFFIDRLIKLKTIDFVGTVPKFVESDKTNTPNIYMTAHFSGLVQALQ
jgi:hypothetical protein